MKSIKIGTRGSALALAQTELVCSALQKKFSDLTVEIIKIKTTGDKILDAPLSKIGVKSLFAKEIEEALLEGKIDLAVHSLKDLPTEIQKKLEIGAVLKREDAHDCLVSKEPRTLKNLPKGARVGTSSLRRAAQILALRPDIQIENLRGNLDTRMRKLNEEGFDAIVAALAGLERLKPKFSENWKTLKVNQIPFWEILPAAGQGFLAIEIRSKDLKITELVEQLNDRSSQAAAFCERAFLRTLEGGCQVPIGALAEVEGAGIHLEGLISSLDGKKMYREKISGLLKNAEEIGKNLAETLLSLGGEKILESIRN